VIAEMNRDEINRPDVAEATLQGPHGTLAFRLFKTEVCFQIANDIFAGTTYPNIPFVSGVKTILDIGANVGAASVYLAMSYPEARVYAFEPGSDALSLLRGNVEQLGNVSIFPFGLYDQDKTLPLFHGKNDSVESSLCASTRTAPEAERVRLQCASQFLSDNGIANVDILKIDTEGCELPILRSLSAYLPEVKVLYVEYHSERDRRMIDEMLAETHVLWRGHVRFAYRGEFCYLKRELVPDEDQIHTCEIFLSLD
jgi:FkbM family methyltransferase